MTFIKTMLESDVTNCDVFICAAELGFSPLGVFLGRYSIDNHLLIQTCKNANMSGEPQLLRADEKKWLVITPAPDTRRAISKNKAFEYAYKALCLCRDTVKAEIILITHLSGHTFPPACFDGITEAITKIEEEGPGTIREINIYDCCLSATAKNSI